MTRRPPLLALAAAVAGAVAFAACEAPIDPLADSDLHYSLSGYLDASADTQWVRVEPFGPVDVRPDGPLDAAVTLGTPGGTVPLAQEVRAYPNGPAHLFWTTADIEPGRTYRLRVQGADGTSAATDVRVPDVRDIEVVLTDEIEHCPTDVAVDGAARVVDVQARYEIVSGERAGLRFRLSKLPSLRREADGRLHASIYFGDDANYMEVSGFPWLTTVTTEVMVAIGTEDWPALEGLTLEGALAAADVGRVEGGVGFVGGVVTRTLPFEPGLGRIPPFEGSGIDPLPCEARFADGFED